MDQQDKELRCFYCYTPFSKDDQNCPHCGQPTHKTVCGNCHEALNPDDRYCRFCGTNVIDGPYAPYSALLSEILSMEEIYGPRPVERVHTCEKCGYQWSTCAMIDSERFCPKCGGEAPANEIQSDSPRTLIAPLSDSDIDWGDIIW